LWTVPEQLPNQHLEIADRMHERIVELQYSRRTERSYLRWIRRFQAFYPVRTPAECLNLRVQDIDFSRNEILVRNGKSAKDRITMLSGAVLLPEALDRNYPRAVKEWRRQWVFRQKHR
jgi:integrase